MKRLACILLAICFMVGILPGVSMRAAAEEAVKLQEAILDFAAPSAGEALPDTFTVNEGFVVDQFVWEIYRDGDWQDLSVQELVYAEDQTYKLRLQLVCAAGYSIDFESFSSGFMPAVINGEATQASFFGEKGEQKVNQWKGVVLETVIFGSAVPAVKSLDISGIPMEHGDAFRAQQIVLSDANVSLRDCQINVDGEAAESFRLGYGFYNIHIDIAAADGYVLNMDQITVNGIPAADCGWDVAYGFEVGDGWISLSCNLEPEGYIDGVTISGVPSEISDGAQIVTPDLRIMWSSNGSVTVSKTQWVDGDHVPVTGNFASGNVYYLAITMQTDSDTPFRDFFHLELQDEAGDYHASALASSSSANTAVAYIAYALLPTVDSLQIYVDQPAIGAAPGVPRTGAGAKFVIESYQWIDLMDQSAAAVFEDGHVYQLNMQIRPAEGYLLRQGAVIHVNGTSVETVGNTQLQSVSVEFPFVRQIQRVEVSVDAPVELTVPGRPVLLDPAVGTILKYGWLAAQTGEVAEQFVPGNRYYLDLEIQAADGAVFTSDTAFTVNGSSVKAVLVEDRASVRVTFDLTLTQTELQLQGVPDGIVPDRVISVPAIGVDSPYITVQHVAWLDEDRQSIEGSFAPGNIYYLAITLQADALHPFAQNLMVYTGILQIEAASDDGMTAVVYIRYSLLTRVELAQITVLPPVLGDAPAAPVVEDGAQYGILSYSWTDLATNTECTVFEDGHSYVLRVELSPKDGVEFGELAVLMNGEGVSLSASNSEYAVFTVEYSFRSTIDRIDLYAPELMAGMEVTPSDIVVLTEGVALQSGYWVNALNFEELNGTVQKAHYILRFTVRPMDGYEFADGISVYLNGNPVSDYSINTSGISGSVTYDLRDVISDIQISGMPQITIGGSTAPITMTVPEGAPYTVQANWLLYGGDYQFAGPGGAFEEGKLYYLEILVKPLDGYRIAPDAVTLVDGAAFTGIFMTGDSGIWLYKQYNCGLQVIDRVDLTVTVPVAGRLPEAVTLPQGVPVSMRDFSWAYCETGEFADAVDLLEGDIFEPGYHYMISGVLVADKGYIFAENLTITVNGEHVNIDLGDLGVINLGDMAFLGHSFGLLQQQSQQPDPTGDSIGIVLAVFAASAGAWLTLKKMK